MIVNHRINETNLKDERFDEFDRRTFKRNLFKFLNNDFENPSLIKFYYETKKIREIESIQKVLVKSDRKLELEEEFSMRRAIGAAAESLGGGYLPICY